MRDPTFNEQSARSGGFFLAPADMPGRVIGNMIGKEAERLQEEFDIALEHELSLMREEVTEAGSCCDEEMAGI